MTRNRTAALILMLVVTGILNADQNIMNATLGLIEKDFHVTDADIGLMSGLFTVLGAVVSLFAGYLTDKGNRKWLFIFSVLVGEIPCFLTAFATNYPVFFFLRVLSGFGVGASFPLVYSILGDMYEEKKRASTAGMMTAAIGIGQIIGIVLGGYFSGTVMTWRLPFIIASVPNIPLLIAYFILVPETRRGASEESVKELIDKGMVYPKTIRISDYLKLVKVKTNVLLFIQGLMGTVPWGAIPLFLVKFLSDQKGFTIAQGTTVFLIFGAGNILGTVFGGVWGGKLFKTKAAYLPLFCSITTVAGSLFALALFTVVPSGNLMLMILCGFIGSFLVSMTGPNMKTMLLDTNVPENRGAIFSIFNLTDSVGTGIGKYFAGVLSGVFGLTLSLSISTLFWVPCAVVLLVAGFFFAGDIRALHRKMRNVAEQMRNKKSQYSTDRRQ